MKIQGIYNKTLYKNSLTGTTTFIFNLDRYDDKGNKVYKCKGKIPSYAPGSPLTIEGELTDSKEDTTFNVVSSDYNITEKRMLTSFINACLPAGMGIKKAEDVVKLLDSLKTTLDEFILRENALDYLLTLNGFNKQNSILFLNKVESSLIEKDLFYSLAKFGVKFSQVNKLCEKYGSKVTTLIKENPYEVLYEIGISFSKIDVYAKENGYNICDSNRIKSLVNLTTLNLMAQGHTFADVKQFVHLFRRTERQSSAFDEQIPLSLIGLEISQNNGLKIDNDKIYAKEALGAEKRIIADLKRLTDSKIDLIASENIEAFKKSITELDDTQKGALNFLKNSSLCALVGGPGTGKTTTIKKVVECFKKYCPDKKYALVAPTGRAAQRIKEASGEEALTIHMLLEYYFQNGETLVTYNVDNQLDVDFIIIDEFSMVGLFLFRNLLQALKNGTKIMIVGDWNQLQSIEPGSLLHDIVDSKKFDTVFLTAIHRQNDDSPIIDLSKDILEGKRTKISDSSDIRMFHCNNNEEGRLLAKELYQKITQTEKNNDCICLCPQRKGDYGVESLNSLIQGELHTTAEPYITYGNYIFFDNDKVMTTRNNYDEYYYNGDLWNLKNIISEDEILLQNKNELNVTLKEENIEDLDLAYAMTVHKCQGSEVDTCIIFLPENTPVSLRSRELLNTAVSRAKNKLYIIDVNDSYGSFLLSPLSSIRNSDIKQMLINTI